MDFLDHCGGDILVADHMSADNPYPQGDKILVRYVFPYSSTELRVPWVYLVGP
jgi:hypothetical protein